MTQLADDISYDRWVQHVFAHPVVKPQWWFHFDEEINEEWNSEANPTRTLEYLTHLFQTPAFLIDKYSRAQIDQGLYYIVNSSCSNHMFVLRDESLPIQDRCACIHAMSTLFADLMAPVYGNDLAAGKRRRTDPQRPNTACYMWWDIIPLYGGLDHPDLDELNNAVLRVLRETLKLKAEACLESALHGCGHWHPYKPREIASIVRYFLSTREDVSAALREYARHAAVGYVL